jgi:hypothetical protein
MSCSECKKNDYKDMLSKIDKRTNMVVTILLFLLGFGIYGLYSLISKFI